MTEAFPKASTPEDGHYFTVEAGKYYDTYKLIEYGKEVKPVRIEIDDLKDELSQVTWQDEAGMSFKPIDLLGAYEEEGSWENVSAKKPNWSRHIYKVQNADYSYPILIHNYLVIDGMHRLVKAYIDKQPDIYVRIIDELPEDARFKV